MDLTSPHAFWLLRNGIGDVPPPLLRDRRCDVAVIGAGITDALTAEGLASVEARGSPEPETTTRECSEGYQREYRRPFPADS